MSNEVSISISDEERQRFYALVGHCVLRFQHVEDFLEDTFAAVLGGVRERADAIFASVRGLDRKIQLIKAAAIGLIGEPPWDGLDALMTRVKTASDVRGQIAHAKPVQSGGLIRIGVRVEEGRMIETTGVEQVEGSRMELHKNQRIFSADDLLREYRRIDTLFGDLLRFVDRIPGVVRPTVDDDV
jgi:hypothetical protein